MSTTDDENRSAVSFGLFVLRNLTETNPTPANAGYSKQVLIGQSVEKAPIINLMRRMINV